MREQTGKKSFPIELQRNFPLILQIGCNICRVPRFPTCDDCDEHELQRRRSDHSQLYVAGIEITTNSHILHQQSCTIAGCGDNLGGRCYVKNKTEEVGLLTTRRVASEVCGLCYGTVQHQQWKCSHMAGARQITCIWSWTHDEHRIQEFSTKWSHVTRNDAVGVLCMFSSVHGGIKIGNCNIWSAK